MRFEQDGIMFWFGTSDAPAPRGVVKAGERPTVTIGVRPMSGGNRVEVQFQTRSGGAGNLAADWWWTDSCNKVQYFRAHLPPMPAGERVEYRVTCQCSGRQAPAFGTEHLFPGSYRVEAQAESQGENHGS